MATTNIHLAKHFDGKPVDINDLRVGLKVDFPSGLGGTLTHKCVSIDAKVAQFDSVNKDWPRSILIEFDKPDFTIEEFDLLSDALDSFTKLGSVPNDAQRTIVARGKELGYANVQSFTQAHWTQKGIEAYKASKVRD